MAIKAFIYGEIGSALLGRFLEEICHGVPPDCITPPTPSLYHLKKYFAGFFLQRKNPFSDLYSISGLFLLPNIYGVNHQRRDLTNKVFGYNLAITDVIYQ
jgi:hypothetical protein